MAPPLLRASFRQATSLALALVAATLPALPLARAQTTTAPSRPAAAPTPAEPPDAPGVAAPAPAAPADDPGVTAPTPAPAEGPLVLLPLEGEQPIPALDGELEQTLRKLGKKLRISSLPREDLMIAAGCFAVDAACLRQIGAQLQAGGLILPETEVQGEAVTLRLRWVRASDGKDAGAVQTPLSRDHRTRQEQLYEAVQKLFGLRADGPAPGEFGALEVTSPTPGVEARLNGEPRGLLPLSAKLLEPGEYTVELSAEGYRPWQRTVTVEGGRTTRLEVTLRGAPASLRAGDAVAALRWPTWTAAGLGLVSLVAGGAFGGAMLTNQSEADDLPDQSYTDVQRLQDLRDTGQRNALTANILFAVGGAALVTAGVLAYFDIRAATAPPDERQKSTTTTIEATLRPGPGSLVLQGTF